MNEPADPNLAVDSEDSASPKCECGYMRIARAVIGTLLLTVMLGNLVVFAAPEWAATLGSILPTGYSNGGNCSSGGCPSRACCPEMLPIGLPASVLEAIENPMVDEIEEPDAPRATAAE